MMEHEITGEVELALERAVNPEAVGWSRRPLHRASIDGAWGRRKRWHHWCVTSEREVIALTLADLDYAGLAIAMAIDRTTGEIVKDVDVRPGGWRIDLPPTAGRGLVDLRTRKTEFAFDDDGARITLAAKTPKIAADIVVDRPAGHETLGVAVTWPRSQGRAFAYTSKQTALPAHGCLAIRGALREVAPNAYACLDYGRGIWPRETSWNWASAAGVSGNRTIGFNLGARWTDGGGATENALLVSGVLQKIGTEVAFEFDQADPKKPWRLRGPDVRLVLEPETIEASRVPGVGRLTIAFGRFYGWVRGVSIKDLFGWAEELHVRW